MAAAAAVAAVAVAADAAGSPRTCMTTGPANRRGPVFFSVLASARSGPCYQGRVITLDAIGRQHGRQILFTGASAAIHPGEKVGLVGPNGSGKTTLFRMITKEESPDLGSVSWPKTLTIGYFKQEVGELRDQTVVASTMDGAGPVSEVMGELRELEAALADPARLEEMDRLVERFGVVQGRFEELDGYSLEARAREILAGLGFSQTMMDQDVGAMSGGWKMRVALGRILLMRPDVLLLDEPTNHLDLESILWLEEFLKRYEGALLMTCHDREFMNRIVAKILEIEGGDIVTYGGNYDFYEAQRVLNEKQAEAQPRPPASDAQEGRALHRALQGTGCQGGPGPVEGQEARRSRSVRAGSCRSTAASCTRVCRRRPRWPSWSPRPSWASTPC